MMMEDEAKKMGEETKFHWAEGMKYALEGIKTLFILNGAATVSILTFIGNNKSIESNQHHLFQTDLLVYSMCCFALGAATGPIAFFLAYQTQLNYGNSGREPSDTGKFWAKGQIWNFLAQASFACGVLLFLFGVILAGCALKQAS